MSNLTAVNVKNPQFYQNQIFTRTRESFHIFYIREKFVDPTEKYARENETSNYASGEASNKIIIFSKR